MWEYTASEIISREVITKYFFQASNMSGLQYSKQKIKSLVKILYLVYEGTVLYFNIKTLKNE